MTRRGRENDRKGRKTAFSGRFEADFRVLGGFEPIIRGFLASKRKNRAHFSRFFGIFRLPAQLDAFFCRFAAIAGLFAANFAANSL